MSNSLWREPTRFLCCGILQARILEWVVMPSSRGSSQTQGTLISSVSCTSRWVLYHWRHLEAQRRGHTINCIEVKVSDLKRTLEATESTWPGGLLEMQVRSGSTGDQPKQYLHLLRSPWLSVPPQYHWHIDSCQNTSVYVREPFHSPFLANFDLGKSYSLYGIKIWF